MTGLEVLLIVLGFVFVGLSFFLSEKGEEKESKETMNQASSKELWSEKDEAIVRERIESVINEQSVEIVEETKERLSQISNEKIMAVDEFSSQLLEKIEQNHKEVVFMYNMLDEKEKQLKTFVQERPKAIPKKTESAIEAPKKVKAVLNNPTEPTPKKAEQNIAAVSVAAIEEPVQDINKRIRQMYQSGKSILEISKEMGMGQGEVKLVIDLYGGRR